MDLKSLIYKQALHLKRISPKRDEDIGIFHASESGKCKRALVLSRMGKVPERAPAPLIKQAELEMLFNDGRLHQKAITDYLFQAPGVHITSIEETRVMRHESGIIVVGHPDGIAYEPKPKDRWIVEVKGLNHFSCQKLKDGDVDTLKIVYGSAIPQARMYCRMFDTKKVTIKGAVILVKNKNTSEIYQFIIPRDKDAENRIILKFIEVYEHCKGNTEPACDWTKGDKNTNFCDYPNDCGVGR